MKYGLRSSTTAACVLSAMLLAGASTNAQAVTCTADSSGSLNVYLADSCTLPTAGEQKVFFEGETATTSGTGHVGSQNGPIEASITSSSNIDLSEGFARIDGTAGNFSDLTFSLPGYTFGDLAFDIKLDNFGSANDQTTFPLVIQAFDAMGLAGTLNYLPGELTANANLSFLLLASAGERFTSVVISSMFGDVGGIKSIRHIQVSDVQPTAVPLPTAFLLLLSGLGGFGLLAARSRTKAI